MNTTGLLVAATVLALATGLGLWRRRTDGRLRAVDATPAPATPAPVATLPDAAAPAAVSSAPASLAGRAPGSPADTTAAQPAMRSSDRSAQGQRIDASLLAALGVQPAPATLLQFSTAFCAPCRAVRRISCEVAQLVPGVQHVEVDAESHLDAVRVLGIWRTPTLLVLNGEGRVVRRATGVPSKPQLIAVLGDVLPAA